MGPMYVHCIFTTLFKIVKSKVGYVVIFVANDPISFTNLFCMKLNVLFV